MCIYVYVHLHIVCKCVCVCVCVYVCVCVCLCVCMWCLHSLPISVTPVFVEDSVCWLVNHFILLRS